MIPLLLVGLAFATGPFHEPVVVSLVRLEGATPALSLKILDGQGGYEVGQLRTSWNRLVSYRLLEEVRALVGDSGFWDLPREVARVRNGQIMLCLDGAGWTLEGVRDGRYHYIHRHCPDEGETVRLLGEHLLGLTGESFADLY